MKKALLLLICASMLLCLFSCTEESPGTVYAQITMENGGVITLELYGDIAPITVNNFIAHANKGTYDGTIFHRVIKDFMIQGGDPNGDGTGDSDKTIMGEFSDNGYMNNDIKHYPGVISMARGDSMNSASCQFFICNADARSSLDGKYAAFGYVIMGMSVIHEITEKVFPKTALADYYGVGDYHPMYGVPYHTLWSYYGNGAIEKDSDKPVIEYIKILEDYTPDFDYFVEK